MWYMSITLYLKGIHYFKNSILVYHNNMNKFSKKLKELRDDNNLLQKQLASELGVSQVTIARWETGVREPSFDDLIKIAKYFGVTTDYILGLED